MHLNTQPFHASTRTSVSTNVNPETSAREQTLTTSQLELSWRAGELHIRCRASRVVMCVERELATARGGRRMS